MRIQTTKAARSAVIIAVLAPSVILGSLHLQNSIDAANQEQTQAEIASALSAGPANITDHATVAEPDGHGGLKVLRPGTNDFTCMPGNPNGTGNPPLCADKVAMQWNKDFEEHKPKPTTTVPGMEYMLAGATQRSDLDLR